MPIYLVGLFVPPWLLVFGLSRTSLMGGGDGVVCKIPCQDLKSLIAHPHQEFQGVLPGVRGVLH